jgi:ABC-2 type transport system permease protein
MNELKIYWSVFKSSLQAKMEYKLDFLIGMITSIMLQLAALGLLWVVIHQSPLLGGWTGKEVLFLFGISATALGTAELLFNHIWMLPYYIVMGDLDRLLIYPTPPLPFLLISSPVLHSFGNLLTGMVLLIYCLSHFHEPWYIWMMVPLWSFCGTIIYTSMLVCICSLSFKFIGPYTYNLNFVHSLLQASRYPLSIYPNWLKYLLLFLIPFGAFNFLPGNFIFHKLFGLFGAWIAPVFAALSIWIAKQLWTWGLKNYQSTGT